jgi:hypothetical protein
MKLTMKWGGKSQKSKACRATQKIRWDLLGIPDPRKGPVPKSIEEIRRQAQAISSLGLGQDSQSTSAGEKSKKVSLSSTGKPTRKPKPEAKAS